MAMGRLSAEIFTIPLEGGRHLVYAPRRRAAFVANAELVNVLASLREGALDAAQDPDGGWIEFLRAIEVVDGGAEPIPGRAPRRLPEPTSVTLLLTTACNLRCSYCYAAAGDTPVRSMRLEEARRGIDFVSGNAARNGCASFEVNYHGGGEPTIHWRVMTASHEYARERGRELGLGVCAYAATNGVLGDQQIDWIAANLNGVSLSFDGLPAAHDRHRLTVLGEPSSARVRHTLGRFDEAGFPYGIRVTVTADQIPVLPDSIEFICASYRPQRIQVEPAYRLGRWRDAPSAESEAFVAAYREAQARAQRYGREICFSAARAGLLTNHFCSLSQDLFALSPDGSVSACFEVFSESQPFAESFFYGRPDRDTGGYRFDLAVLEALRRQAVEHREFCRGCFAKWSCAGDCYHKSLAVNGAAEFCGSDRCHITREITKDQILEKIARSGGWFWHEPNPEVSQ